jgi:NAD(P)-dependent dehydrogenase (short-subunit alcohol dehydrogenase family)
VFKGDGALSSNTRPDIAGILSIVLFNVRTCNFSVLNAATKVEQFGQKNTPFGRPAQPAEVAPAFVFLASSDASFVNGEVLGVTGGQLIS